MPLTEDDLDRLGDKLELAVGKAMKEHIAETHKPMLESLGALQGDVKFAKGVSYAIGGIVAVAESIMTWARGTGHHP